MSDDARGEQKNKSQGEGEGLADAGLDIALPRLPALRSLDKKYSQWTKGRKKEVPCWEVDHAMVRSAPAPLPLNLIRPLPWLS